MLYIEVAMEESIDLNGSGDQARKKEGVEQADHINNMDVSVPDLGDKFTGQSNEQLLDSILDAARNHPDQLIQWEECHLPSLGLYYPNWVDGMIKCKAMGQQADKILATQRYAQSGQAMDFLFAECCRFPDGFNPIDLLLGDRTFLLFYLRGITHGNLYEFALTCPDQNCGHVSTHQYDLNDLAETIIHAKPALGPEPIKVVLPYLSEVTKREFWVGVRFLRGYDANDILARKKVRSRMFAKPGGVRNRMRPTTVRQQQETSQQLDESINQNMEKIIVNVMGIADLFKIREFINTLHGQDTAAIREWLRENTPGIDNTVTVECPECTTTYTVELPISESFFRPTKQRRT